MSYQESEKAKKLINLTKKMDKLIQRIRKDVVDANELILEIKKLGEK